MSNTNTIPGQAGGRAVVEKYGKTWMRKIGLKGAALGGQAVVEKYGTHYMSLIGTIGSDVVNGHLTDAKFNKITRKIDKILRSGE